MILIVKSSLARNTGAAAARLTVLACVLATTLATTLALTGCGQTGPLYMPKPPAKQAPVPVPPHLPSASSPAAQ